jgi:HAD superfamily hydrolase (TIGR01509 family)
MDGTIVDVPYDWPKIKEELGSRGLPILSYLSNLPEPERSEKWAVLTRYEDEATRRAVLRRGIRALLERLAGGGIATALVTNNSAKNTKAVLGRFHLMFDLVLTRESGLWKPSGAPLRSAMTILGLNPNECCAVGDSRFDIVAAQDAGIPRIYLLHRGPRTSVFTNYESFGSVAALRKRIERFL